MTEPNESDEFRRRREREGRRRRIAARILDVLIVLALLAIGILVLRMIL